MLLRLDHLVKTRRLQAFQGSCDKRAAVVQTHFDVAVERMSGSQGEASKLFNTAIQLGRTEKKRHLHT